MTSMFLDTSYLLALELANDQNHALAVQHWQGILAARPQFVTTSYVLDEVVTFLNSRGQHAKAVQVGNSLLHSASIHFVHIDETLFYNGWAYFQRHQDKQSSLTDCISFVVMQRFRIATALTFDRHFLQAGFQTQP